MRFPARLFSSASRLAAVFAVAAVAASGAAYYSFFVAQQAQYLEGRNFRLLGALAAQTEGAIESEARRFQTLAGEPKSGTWTYLKTRRYRDADLPDELPRMHRPEVAYSLNAAAGKFYVRIALTDKGPQNGRAALTGEDAAFLQAPASPAPLRIPLPLIVAPIFKPKLPQSAFDTVGLATQRGTTWFATGRHASELLATGLDALVRQAKRDAADRPFAEVVQTTVLDLAIGGTRYRLFAQPCCAFTGNDDRMMVIGLVAADEFRAQSWAISTTVVKGAMLAILLALVLWPFIKLACLGPRQRVRTFDVFQLAASGVAALALLTISGLDAYAYWRLNRDAAAHLQTLAAGIQENFKTEMTSAVEQLSCLKQLDVHPPGIFGDMLARDVLIVREPNGPEPITCRGIVETLPKPHARAAGAAPKPVPDWPYPFFESFSRIDGDDKQQVKLATTRWVPSRVQVGTRRYVTDIRDHKEWKDETLCPDGCVLESLWAWTSGEPQAVLSRGLEAPPAVPGKPRGRGEIVTLALYLPSVIRPVLPPGFEFAVIDGAGKVWFHSDRYRNGYEDFFAETDGNRRLRAQVLAHSAESLDLHYWGAPYRAFVQPLGLFDLSLVTLQQKENSWALNREWLIVALLLLAAYLAVWVTALLLALGPDASWVWPDPARRARYIMVSGISLAILIECGMVVAYEQGAGLLWWAFGLPCGAWAATFVLLRRRPSPAAAATATTTATSAAPAPAPCEPSTAYGIAAVLFLLVTAVVPGVLFFTASFQLHVQSYIKRSDFQLLRALAERDARLKQDYSDDRGKARNDLLAGGLRKSGVDRYHSFFYGTNVEPAELEPGKPGAKPPAPELELVDAGPSGAGPSGAQTTFRRDLKPEVRAFKSASSEEQPASPASDFLIGILEGLLPYYAEASVEWRELLHNEAGDRSWWSKIADDGQLVVTLNATAHASRRLTSSLPALLPPSTGDGKRTTRAAVFPVDVPSFETIVIVSLGLLIVAAACVMVLTLTRRLFLSGVTNAVRATARLTDGAGGKLLILCDAAAKAQPMLGAARLEIGEVARHAHPDAALKQALSDLARDEPGAVLLIDDLDANVEKTSLMLRKLGLMQQLAADATRAVVVRSTLAPRDLLAALPPTPAAAPAGRRAASGGGRTSAAEERSIHALDAFLLIDWRTADATTDGATLLDPLFASEGRGHALVRQLCDRLRRSEAVQAGLLTRQELLQEIAERAAPCYRRLWDACSDDEQLVLAHVARDGWVHASARQVVRRLLGRRLLEKDPALRLMNGTFRSFVLSSECRADVTRLESATVASTWDQLRLPLGVCVVGAAVFLFATQRELYNAILGLTTTAAVSVPSLIRAVGMLAGRRVAGDGDIKV
jgi:hypothetical protein